MDNFNDTLPNWDLSSLYSGNDSDKLKQDFESLDKNVKLFANNYENKISDLTPTNLVSAISDYEKIEDVLGKISSYAYLVFSQNITDSDNAQFYQNTSESINEYSSQLLFFTLEINKLSDEDINEKLKDEGLRKYSPWIRDLRAFKNYQLSDDLEKILLEKSLTSRQSWIRLFDETIAQMQFDLDGKKLTSAEIFNNLSSTNQDLRKRSAKSIGKSFADNIKLLAHITNVLAKDKSIEDKWRGFASPISSRNLDNCVEDEVTQSLISTVEANYEKTAHRYYKIKAKMLGQEKLDYWDRNAPLSKDEDDLIPWEKAKDIVLEAYSNFSPEIGEIGKRFFDNNWIDAKTTNGKDSGAYSHPTVPSANPFILMNYQGKSRDVMTLAHELGHGVHQVLSAKQGVLMADTPLTLAETASVFGEQLTFRSMLENEKNTDKKKILIANKVEDMLKTVVRQIAFCKFETQLHDLRKEGEVSVDKIGEIWLKTQKDSLGDSIRFDDEYKYFWSYIPHFVHSPFYVYAYGFGDCLVNSLYQKYCDSPDGFSEKYIQMLKAGGTLRHKELLKPFGLDASDPKFWQGGIDMIIELIDEI